MLMQSETISILTIPGAEFSAAPLEFAAKLTFVDLGVRLQELVVFVVCASLIAIIVLRSRRLVLRQVKAERERHFVREALGKYVPVAVANAIVADRGVLKPQRQTATMLFADIEGFTGLVERSDPAEVFAILNDYFSAIGAAIVDQGGVINQFQGDAVLATFNLPVDDPDHAAAAVRAALGIRQACEGRTFSGQAIRPRVGIATGEVIAGSVGSGSQLAYTVHGDAVNLAARLEQMNKRTDTNILIAGETVRAAGQDLEANHVGEIPIRGRAAADVYSI
jgi:class 3 adenylate cyclase